MHLRCRSLPLLVVTCLLLCATAVVSASSNDEQPCSHVHATARAQKRPGQKKVSTINSNNIQNSLRLVPKISARNKNSNNQKQPSCSNSNKNSNLSNVADCILGDDGNASSFVEELQRQEAEWQKAQEEQEDAAAAKNANVGGIKGFLDRWKSPQTSLWSLGGTLALLGIAAIFDPSVLSSTVQSLHKLAKNSLSALLIAWVPLFLFGGGSVLGFGWIEASSLLLLFIRSTSVRQLIAEEVLPTIQSTGHKLLIAELWKNIWSLVWAPVPQPLFTPENLSALRIPKWIKSKLQYVVRVIDKFTQGLVKSFFKESVNTAIGGISASNGIELLLPEFAVDWSQWRDGNLVSGAEEGGDENDDVGISKTTIVDENDDEENEEEQSSIEMFVSRDDNAALGVDELDDDSDVNDVAIISEIEESDDDDEAEAEVDAASIGLDL